MMFAVVNGPNLNRLGVREPQIYGSTTLEELQKRLQHQAQDAGHQLVCVHSNHEGALIEAIHGFPDQGVRGVVVNLAGYTHTSVALLDALLSVSLPYIEVHVSNIYARESFRHHSYISPHALGVVCGLGVDGYSYALDHLIRTTHP